MRGTVAKRLRKLRLRSGPRKRPQRTIAEAARSAAEHDGFTWHRRTALEPNPVAEAKAEAKRTHRLERNRRTNVHD